ncbi:4'-phosphopantetheinyl transferase family protein [Flavobacterium gawalongense]|uniref:4'-phosphopantetheinyl transferase superfamily protein n=1 Tax=Flavobacterium gawalongense TaxID=2594432 RepID=A0A553BX73_9FLAO|nr:4'-phosphopantetheinyl transferase superfamily protein [Flavobacterium gawalongense]TRX12775.1 4'-phosphopantetheinyl transferase superfamily protein [Flavobacterium gawalongense]TRX13120.1 4'-phosphopantetheinyl transferase superfamily protein [Flavobacterium gawalongense]TRX30818.1 4'-phosphopantetheinyl transferase superfamily protein [Flavobacterium gawalongense]
MPLFKTIHVNSTTQILVWKVTETYAELFGQVVLNDTNRIRLDGMKSEMQQRAFLSVRKLLQETGHTDLDLYYDEFGKPHLNGEKHISITHSHNFSAIIISDETVGIDIELQRDKIIRIADKFCDSEFQFLSRSFGTEKKEEYIRKLTVIWGAKEAIFKIRNEKGISFKDHIKVNAFDLEVKQTIAELHFDSLVKDFKVHFEEIDPSDSEQAKQNFTLVYAFEN